MKRLLLLLGTSLVVGCSGAASEDVGEGDEQAVVSGSQAPDPNERKATTGNRSNAIEQTIELRGVMFSDEALQGPTDPQPWRRPVEGNEAK